MPWITIGERELQLTPNAQRVQALMDKGLTQMQICARMHICREEYEDYVYEIRKVEMSKMKLTEEIRKEIVKAAANGTPQETLAQRHGVTKQRIAQIVASANKADAERKVPRVIITAVEHEINAGLARIEQFRKRNVQHTIATANQQIDTLLADIDELKAWRTAHESTDD